jgi:hypothetical protein
MFHAGSECVKSGVRTNARNSRLRDDDMLGWLADAARLFGCIPATTDMEMYRSSGRRLPCHQAFMHHFGSKAGMLRSLKRRTAASPERADIAAMLGGIRQEPDPPRRIMGAVYLLRSGRSYKIGCSRAPQQRVRDVQQSLPNRRDSCTRSTPTIPTASKPAGTGASRKSDLAANGSNFRRTMWRLSGRGGFSR